MDFRIRWAPRAVSHLEQICKYISQDSETYARIFAKKVLSIVEDIPSFPKAGRVVPNIMTRTCVNVSMVTIALCIA